MTPASKGLSERVCNVAQLEQVCNNAIDSICVVIVTENCVAVFAHDFTARMSGLIRNNLMLITRLCLLCFAPLFCFFLFACCLFAVGSVCFFIGVCFYLQASGKVL